MAEAEPPDLHRFGADLAMDTAANVPPTVVSARMLFVCRDDTNVNRYFQEENCRSWSREAPAPAPARHRHAICHEYMANRCLCSYRASDL